MACAKAEHPPHRRYVLIDRLQIRLAQNDCPLFVSLPASLSRDDLSHGTQLLFENFNLPSLTIAEEPLLCAYAAGTLTSTVVDFGWQHCTTNPILESSGLVHSAVQHSGVGIRHIILYLAHLLSKDESIVQALIKLDATRQAQNATSVNTEEAGNTLALRLFELALALFDEGKLRASVQGEDASSKKDTGEEGDEFDVAAALVAGREKAAVEEQERKNRAVAETDKQPEGSVSDHVQTGASIEEGAETISFQGTRIKVAPGPLASACDVLWDPSLLTHLRGALASASTTSFGPSDLGATSPSSDFSVLRSLPETLAASIAAVPEVERRRQLWETLLPTGAPVRQIANLNSALVATCQSYLASNADNAPAGGAFATNGPALASAGPTSRDSPGVGGDIEGAAQPTHARCIKTPDYFAEFKDRTDLAPFLGATIYAKLAFTDPYGRLVLSKAAYNEKGPAASFLVSASS